MEANNPPWRKQSLAAAREVKNCTTEINDTFVGKANVINNAVPMYNLTEYSDNYSDTSGSLSGFKRDDITNNANVANDDNASSFKYKASLITNTKADGIKKGVKIAVPLKYLSNSWRLLEMPLINCKVKLSLKWIENCVLTTAEAGANADSTVADNATFEITDEKLYVPVVTLSAKDNEKLVRQLSKGFKRPVYWNRYKVIDNKVVENCLILVIKELKDCLFLLMIIQQIIIKFQTILLKNIFFQELKLKTTTSKLIEKIFMISQLMTRLSKTMKSEKS